MSHRILGDGTPVQTSKLKHQTKQQNYSKL